ncbi:MADF domain-containing protein [Meloidogyne graminicola]|uniref:MADF domain-containing protein n=1 Tax=Meloidogyne graminicola TaxID=189291 RepID=A0A8T0A2Y7_9BILA|nr:MADF domain-containing protein [Meloidogyne graminicola]
MFLFLKKFLMKFYEKLLISYYLIIRKMTNNKLTTDLFIELVREKAFLWQKGDDSHKNKEKCDNAWTQIAKEAGLEDYYSKVKKPRASGSDGKEVKWPYFLALSFLDEEKRGCPSRVDSTEREELSELLRLDVTISSDDENDQISLTSPQPVKRRRISNANKHDSVDACIIEVTKQIKDSLSEVSPTKQFVFYCC